LCHSWRWKASVRFTGRYSVRKEASEKEAKRLAAEAMRHEVKAAE
jgi:hypothetical protein